jgi:heat shock protein HslJ
MTKLVPLALWIGIAGCVATTPAPKQAELIGQWHIESIGDRPVIDRSPAAIEFTNEGRAGGNASCNRFTGAYTLSGSELSFGPLAATKMMCPDALMDQEIRFLAALDRVAAVQIQQGILILQDETGETVITATRQ